MEFQDKPAEFDKAFRKSWLAYFGPFIFLAVCCIIAYGCTLVTWDNPYWLKYRVWPIWGFPILGLLRCIFKLLDIYSLVLYTNKDGVWVFSGIFPWNRGVSGIKWQDLEDARFSPGFFNWIFQTYKVRIGHRFTRESEIVLPMMWKGQKAVVHINEELHRRDREKPARA